MRMLAVWVLVGALAVGLLAGCELPTAGMSRGRVAASAAPGQATVSATSTVGAGALPVTGDGVLPAPAPAATVTVTRPAPSPTVVAVVCVVETGLATGTVWVWSQAGGGQRIGVANQGERLVVLAAADGWREVVMPSGRSGFIQTRWCKKGG